MIREFLGRVSQRSEKRAIKFLRTRRPAGLPPAESIARSITERGRDTVPFAGWDKAVSWSLSLSMLMLMFTLV